MCSIAYGVIAGILSYILLNSVPWLISKASKGKIVPPGIEASEEWTIPEGSLIPVWWYDLPSCVPDLAVLIHTLGTNYVVSIPPTTEMARRLPEALQWRCDRAENLSQVQVLDPPVSTKKKKKPMLQQNYDYFLNT